MKDQKTPEEKAKELVAKFRRVGCVSFPEAEINSAKQSAVIAVDEIIEALTDSKSQFYVYDDQFWYDVKTEINKIKYE